MGESDGAIVADKLLGEIVDAGKLLLGDSVGTIVANELLGEIVGAILAGKLLG